MTFRGVSVDSLLEVARPLAQASYVLAFSHSGYTTNLPLADVSGGRAWVAWEADGAPLAREHGGPARLLVPHLYFGKAPNGSPGCACSTMTSPAFGSRTATTTAATPGSNSATKAIEPGDGLGACHVVAIGDETARAKTFRLRLSRPWAHLAGQHYVLRLSAPDGYSAQRSYSVASAPDGSAEIELTIERLPGGEVSMFMHDEVRVGDQLEVRGPIGRWFVWPAVSLPC